MRDGQWRSKAKDLRRVWEGCGVYKLGSGDRAEGVVTWVGWGLPYIL